MAALISIAINWDAPCTYCAGSTHETNNKPSQHHFPLATTESKDLEMTRDVTAEEIKTALFSIADDKAPGPDGFTAKFFKTCWNIIRSDFIAAIRFFFNTLCLPRSVNSTIIALVPKVENPESMSDFRPISCCNITYKCIAKIIVSRIKPALASVIGKEQSTFIPGRHISDAILLSQELLHNYHTDKGPAKCAIKIDIKKAFDTISWSYIINGLMAIGIPTIMLSWIHKCISTASFSVNMNGELHGYFNSSGGLRQGDPLSPYLFVLAMEGLHGIMQRTVQRPQYKYHWRCAKNNITHVCFEDDLLVFCHANRETVRVVREALDEFTEHSGLTINHSKSALYLTGIEDREKEDIERDCGMQLSTLPVKYLGVPLITSRLTHMDCAPLVTKLMRKIQLWTSATLSYAGRLQLIKSVLFSYQVFWSTIFILPCATIRKIESMMAGFLWKGRLDRSGASVAWADVCYPKEEGGLGIKRIKEWNKAATLKHLWNLLSRRQSVWGMWIHTYLLKGQSIWQIQIPSKPTWVWRKILQSREWCRGDFTAKIGNGRHTSLWHDYWLPGGQRISDLVSPRLLSHTGLRWQATVADVIHNGDWMFPSSGERLQAIWNTIPPPPSTSEADQVIWKHHAKGTFSIASAWEKLRNRKANNPHHGLLWYKGHLPRQSFTLWLASQNRLKTLDRLSRAGITDNMICQLCKREGETHNHLFFHCNYSKEVWDRVSDHGQIQWPSIQWDHLLQWATSTLATKKDIKSHIAKTTLSVAVYYLWYERNNRTFNNIHRPPQELSKEIIQLIRGHLMCNEIANHVTDRIRERWNIHSDPSLDLRNTT